LSVRAVPEAIGYILDQNLEPILNRDSAALRADDRPDEAKQWQEFTAAYRASRSNGLKAVYTVVWVMASVVIATAVRLAISRIRRRSMATQRIAKLQLVDSFMSAVLRIITTSVILAIAIYSCMLILVLVVDD
jgi:hypothetical protein